MPAKAFVIHFPNGDYEYVLQRRGLPTVGDEIRLKGAQWTVARTVDDDTPTVFVLPLEPAERRESTTSDRSEKGAIALGPPDE